MNEELYRNKLYIKTPTSISIGNNCWFGLDTKLVGRIKALLDENEQNKQKIVIMERYFELIHDLGYDYDGFEKANDLKRLIDELVRYASLGRVCNTTEPMFVHQGKDYNILMEEIKGNTNSEHNSKNV